jgi:hypothetical protein
VELTQLGERIDDDDYCQVASPVFLCDFTPPFDDDHKYLYHGTSWGSAISIVAQGIILEHGCPLTDFGPSSFYMSQSFAMASEWAIQKGGSQAAIVVYSADFIDSSCNSGDDSIVSCTFDGPTDDWKETVFRFRNSRGFRQCVNKYRDVDIMRGPFCSNVRTAADRDSIACRTNDDGTFPMQIAIRSDAAASRADSKVVGIIFLPATTAMASSTC